MKKNRIYKNIRVEKIGYGGVGIGILENGKKIMIRGGILPNSIVDCRITRQRKDFLEAEVIDVISFDENWANEKPLCPHFNNPLVKTTIDTAHTVGCGGCKWQMTSYAQQIEIKENLILDSFRSSQQILEHAALLPIIPSPQQYYYRNKIEFSFGKYITGKKPSGEDTDDDNLAYTHHDWQLGFHKQGQFSKILDVDQCFLISKKLHSVYKYCKDLLKASNLSTYDQKTHIGFFRHLAMREGIHTGHILVNLVVASEKLVTPQQQKDRDTLHETIKNDVFLKKHVKTFIVTGNNGLADIVKGRDSKSEIIFGDGTIYENLVFSPKIFDKKELIHEDDEDRNEEEKSVSSSFRISPFSFFQTNTYGTEILFGTAAALVGEVKGTILDLYCGAGTIGISFLKMGKGDDVLGIEIVEEAIHDAKFNAEINGCEDNTYFVAGKAEELVYKDTIVQEKLGSLGLVIVDPPRCGLHKNVINFINDLRKNYKGKLLYISCNPVTLARDLELFEQGGWKTKLLQPVDMFPHTHHIETIAILH